MKKIFMFIILALITFSNINLVEANQSSITKAEDFLKSKLTLFLSEEELGEYKSAFFNVNKDLLTFSYYPYKDFKVLDLNDDGIYEIFLTRKTYEDGYVEFYNYVDDEYILSDTFYPNTFYKNNKNEIFVLEYLDSMETISFSKIYYDGLKWHKILIYFDDSDTFYNRIDGKKYDYSKIKANPDIFDTTLKKIEPKNFSNEFSKIENSIKDRMKQGEIFIVYNDELVESDIKSIIRNSRILVPVRVISDTFRASIDWEDKTKTAKISWNDNSILIKSNETTAIVNGEKVSLDSPATNHNGRLYVPIRFIIESMGREVIWVDKLKAAFVSGYEDEKTFYEQKGILNGEYLDMVKNILPNFKNTTNIDLGYGNEEFAFWTNEDILDVKFIEVEFNDDMTFTEKKVLHSIPKLTPSDLLLVKTTAPEGLPYIKISYTDSYKTKWESYIGYDGRLGGLNLSNSIVK